MPQLAELKDLPIDQPIPQALFAANGDRLLSKESIWTQTRKDAFENAGLESFFTPEANETDGSCRYKLSFEAIDINALQSERTLAEPVINESGRLLMQQSKPISPKSTSTLIRQGVTEIVLRRDFDNDTTAKIHKLKTLLEAICRKESMTAIAEEFSDVKLDSTRLAADEKRVNSKQLNQFEEVEALRDIEIDPKTRAKIEPGRLNRWETDEDRERILAARKELMTNAFNLFQRAAKNEKIDARALGELIREVVERIVADRFHRLHIAVEEEDKNYAASHGLSTLILAVNMGGRMNLALNELFELGFAALLHQIGMLRIPSEIQDKADPLTPQERKIIETYPNASLDLCENFRGLPRTTPIVMYQTNERVDGSGYPRKLHGKTLHTYSKIIMVAGTYDALIRNRPYRKSLHPYKAMEQVLREVNGGRFDPLPVKALLETLGLFPIASGVKLSDGRYGRVLDSSGSNYTRPVIRVEADTERLELCDTEIVDLQVGKHETTQIVNAVAPPFDIDADGNRIGSGGSTAVATAS